MKLTIAAIGRLKAGPEKQLIDDWLHRAGRTGRQFGLGPADVIEIDERKFTDRGAQSRRLREIIPPDAATIALDERGEAMTSPAFARLIARERDRGCARMFMMIGGADGLTEELRAAAEHRISFGAMVWPHMLARIMLAEQIYRATTILAGLPYHRE